MEQITTEQFEEKVINQEGKVLVDFFATWCGPCRMLGPLLEQTSKETDVPFYKMDADDCKELAETYNITSLPTVLIFENGQVIETKVGVQPKSVYLELLNG